MSQNLMSRNDLSLVAGVITGHCSRLNKDICTSIGLNDSALRGKCGEVETATHFVTVTYSSCSYTHLVYFCFLRVNLGRDHQVASEVYRSNGPTRGLRVGLQNPATLNLSISTLQFPLLKLSATEEPRGPFSVDLG